jgi:hypothetical protein
MLQIVRRHGEEVRRGSRSAGDLRFEGEHLVQQHEAIARLRKGRATLRALHRRHDGA